MRIIHLKVDGFGVWSGLEMSDLSDHLNVFYGPNEAGKTTLRNFVRAILYGFAEEHQGRYLPPVRPGRPGGSLVARVGERTYAIARHADEAGGFGARAEVQCDRHHVGDEVAYASLLGNVDAALFNNIFAFGLEEIQELGTLSNEQAAKELYSLALGSDRVSIIDVLANVADSRERLLSSEGSPSTIGHLLNQRARLQNEIDALGNAPARYRELTAEKVRLDADVERLQSEIADHDAELRQLALARSLVQRWQRREELQRQLKLLGTVEALPSDAVSRFDQLTARLAARRGKLARLQALRSKVNEDIAALGIKDSLLRLAPRLEALSEQQPWIASLGDQVARLESEVIQLDSERLAASKQNTAKAHTVQVSPHDGRQLRTVARALRNARLRVSKEEANVKATGETAESVARELHATASKHKDQKQALAETGDLVTQLRRRVQLDEKLDQMTRRKKNLEQQSQELLARQMLPPWALVVLGGMFVLGCALVLLFLVGLMLPASLSGSLGFPVCMMGLAAAGVAAGMKFGLEQQAATRLDECYQQIEELGKQMAKSQTERDELDDKLPRGGGPLAVRLQTAEKELAQLESLLPLQSQRESVDREVATAHAQLDAAQAERRALTKRWQQMLAQHRLPHDFKPSQIKRIVRLPDDSHLLDRRLDEKRHELARRRAELDAVTARVNELAAQTGVAINKSSPVEVLRQCLAELAQQQQRLHKRDALLAKLAQLRQRRAKWRRVTQKLQRRRRGILHAADALDEAEFRARVIRYADYERLRGEHLLATQEISAAIAGHYSEDLLHTWLSDPLVLSQLEQRSTDLRRSASDQLNLVLGRRGELHVQLQMLLDDRTLDHKSLELAACEQQLATAAERWRVLAIADSLLVGVRDYLEREHQPRVLVEASRYLRQLTGDRYTRVWTPLGEHRLKVDDQHGKSLGVEVLSRGTREQIFLAIRLAVVASFARRGVRLPLVLDDVLVNFDLGRARAAAIVLRDFARTGNQVLIFTCHEHMAKLFRHIKAEVRQLPDNGRLAEAMALQNQKRAKKPRLSKPLPAVAPAAEELPQEEDLPVMEGPPVFSIKKRLPEPEPLPYSDDVLVLEPLPLLKPLPPVAPPVVLEPRPVLLEPLPHFEPVQFIYDPLSPLTTQVLVGTNYLHEPYESRPRPVRAAPRRTEWRGAIRPLPVKAARREPVKVSRPFGWQELFVENVEDEWEVAAREAEAA